MSPLPPEFRRALPALIMTAGTLPMLSPQAPDHIRYGGACLLGVAMVLADLQSGKKLGYTDKMVAALRKIPGLENADEANVIGALTYAASVIIGGGGITNIAENGDVWPEALKVGYNAVSYPGGALFDFQATRMLMERYFGKEFSFPYTDSDGRTQQTAPISTSSLLQQMALFSGAAGIATYGTLLRAPDIQFTGAMFMLSNGININRIAGTQVSTALRALAKRTKQPLNDEGRTELAQELHTATEEISGTQAPPLVADARDVVEAIAPILNEFLESNPPDRNTPKR